MEAAASMSWIDVAASAYRAYSASTGNKNFRGEPMPEFEDLPQPIKTAWECAVRQTSFVITANFAGITPTKDELNEQRWAGWVPPHLQDQSKEK